MLTVSLILLVLALVCAVLALLGVPSKVSLVGLGLLLVVIALLVTRFPL